MNDFAMEGRKSLKKTARYIAEGVMANLLERFDGFAEPVLKVIPKLGLYSTAVATGPCMPLQGCQVCMSQSASEAEAGVVLQNPGCDSLIRGQAMCMCSTTSCT